MEKKEEPGTISLRVPAAVKAKYQDYFKAMEKVCQQLQLEGNLSDLNWLVDVAGFYLSVPRPRLTRDYELEESKKVKACN